GVTVTLGGGDVVAVAAGGTRAEGSDEGVLEVVGAVEDDDGGVGQAIGQRSAGEVAGDEIRGGAGQIAGRTQRADGAPGDRLGRGGHRGHHPALAQQGGGVVLVLAVQVDEDRRV